MLLTGAEIASERGRGAIAIEPFDLTQVEQNSYGFRLGHRLLECQAEVFDARRPPEPIEPFELPVGGIVLQPNRLYLGETLEIIGSDRYACELYGTLSIASLGVWIQVSAPLGHTGAVIRWTLEIRVTQPIRLHPGMVIGKVAFWGVNGEVVHYNGRYANSVAVTQSRMSKELVR
ncbi:MAG: deoxycytidine triphosphate deaminase [Actinomycetota bacterium]|nr:deoxycytidine triphosphate deaminase [Actinomycetota bacterium]MDQ2957840.1 deoxycytidine triphosphate deaminase [Actinomycetota bacterium]